MTMSNFSIFQKIDFKAEPVALVSATTKVTENNMKINFDQFVSIMGQKYGFLIKISILRK